MSSPHSVLDNRVAQILAIRERSPLPLRQVDQPLPESRSILGLASGPLFPNSSYPAEAHAGLLLLLRCWDESHRVAQELSSAEGSYWHALAHRMEPDPANANYWFRRVGQHPVFSPLYAYAQSVLRQNPISGWTLKETWDPALFGSWCEEASIANGSPKEAAAIKIQQEEWNLLFFWCAESRSAR